MHVQPLRLSGLLLIQPKIHTDERGFFLERYQAERYAQVGIPSFVQDNEVFSKKNVLRGMHYQRSPGQAKLISVVQGRIWDVALDIRPDSPTFNQWEAVELSAEEGNQLFVPIGFAHGYCVLGDNARVHYKVSAPYDPEEEMTLPWNSVISWPIVNPILSDRDRL